MAPQQLSGGVRQVGAVAATRGGRGVRDVAREPELARLRRRVAEVELEKTILRRAAAEPTGQRNSAAAGLLAGVPKSKVLRGWEFQLRRDRVQVIR
jgi:transposase-like protein